MFAISHAATALLIHKRYPEVSIWPILVACQLVELLWVGFNGLGIERTSTDAAVLSVANLHLDVMPFSHSVASVVVLAALSWGILAKALGRPRLAAAFALGVLSHLALDLVTHGPDIALAPGASNWKLGLGPYATAPEVAFVMELAYGILCWRLYRGNLPLLGAIVLANVANVSMFFPGVVGPEAFLANRSAWIVALVLLQIVVTWGLVGALSSPGAATRRRVTTRRGL